MWISNLKKEVIMKLFKNGLLIIAAMMFVGTVFVSAGCERFKHDNAVSQCKAAYHCPMHPVYTSDRPGDCPICGMKLVKAESDSSDKASLQETNMPAQA